MMKFEIYYSEKAESQFLKLETSKDRIKQYKAVAKTLGLMKINLRHPSLHIYKFGAIVSPYGKEFFESHAENKTPGAYRVFWCYGPAPSELYIIAITPHP